MKDPSDKRTTRRRIISGEFHPALETALLEHLSGRIEREAPDEILVTVPTNLLGLHLSRRLSSEVGAHVNVRFVTLKDLGALMAPAPLPDGRALLPPRADRAILRRLLEEGTASGGYFEAIESRPGLAVAILSAIRDLKEARYDPGSLAHFATQAGLTRRTRKNKLAEILRIWRAYEDRLSDEGWADDLDQMRVAAERLESGARPDSGHLTLYGFYDLNPLQRHLVSACADRVDTTVFFPYVESGIFRFARPTLKWLASIGFDPEAAGTEADSRNLPAKKTGARDGALPKTEAGPGAGSLPGETILLSAPGEAREVRENVRLLADLLDEHGLSYQEVAVLTRSSDTYSELFAEELGHLRADAYLEAPPPLSRSRAAKSLLKLARAVESGFARADVIEFLSLANLDMERLTRAGGEAPVSDWNKATMVAGIISGADTWIEKLGQTGRAIAEADPDGSFANEHGHLAGAIDSLVTVLECLIPDLAGLPARATPSEFLDRLTSVYCRITKDDDTNDRGANGCARSNGAEGAGPQIGLTSDSEGESHGNRQAVLACAAKIKALSDITGKIEFPYFVELLRSHLDAPLPRRAKFGSGGPTVLNVMSARGLPFRAVVIPGLVEKLFPLSRRQDPILLDSERRRLNAARGNDPLGVLPIRMEGGAEEELLFHTAMSSAKELLILSFPRLDPATARPRVPSIFMLKVLDELSGERNDYESFDRSPLVRRVPLSRRFPDSRMGALTREEFDGCSILAAAATDDPGEIAYLVNEEPLAGRLEMERARWGEREFTRYDGALIPRGSRGADIREALEALTGITREGLLPGRTVSATKLEEYARCPFRFYMHHVLGIEPLEEPDEALELSPLERGSLYHAVLEKFMRKMKSSGRARFRAADVKLLLKTAEEMTRSGAWSFSGYPGARALVLRSLRSHLAIWCSREAREESTFVPSYFEARFGGKPRPGDDKDMVKKDGLSFEARDGIHLEFEGKIDRIDVMEDGSRARVIDYKTGKGRSRSEKKGELLDRGRMLQLPIYMLAAEGMLTSGGNATEVESAEYRYVTEQTGSRTRFTVTSDLLERRRDDLGRACALIITGIAGGMFFPYPTDSDCCYCDYAQSCGSARVELATIKNFDSRAAFYVEELLKIL